jgi:ribosomal protein S18 acetylase RimI-like enzyme
LSVEIRPLRREDVAWLADLHNAAFADYAVPALLDSRALGSYMDETGVDPALSRVAFVDGHPASFCLGAVRGRRASIRGEGTDPRYRRAGLGGRVLDESLAALRGAGAAEVSLEVLEGNDAAIRLYRRHGFEHRRRLLGFSLNRPPRRGLIGRVLGHLEEMETTRALDLLQEWGWADPPWQLELDTLAQTPALALDSEAVVLGRQRGERFWLYALGVDPQRRRRGLATRALSLLPTPFIGVPALVPEEWYDGRATLRALGASTEQHWQWEMRCAL